MTVDNGTLASRVTVPNAVVSNAVNGAVGRTLEQLASTKKTLSAIVIFMRFPIVIFRLSQCAT